MEPSTARPDLDPGSPDADRYVVAARKYRPQTFGELVAQEHVAQALRNAVRLHRLAHAYLFSGPRGVGKTTAARLLAKAVNCQTPLSDRPDAEPCRQCDACVSFEEGRALNVIEIDAASSRGVEDARDLRETVRIPPQGARKKVYILDEVHMFTKDAFNVLLKTLEEPPAHALFIFATTEPHKVLPTILSRCQRFDFRRIAVPEIVMRVREIAAAEGVVADEESLVLIARRADGALRDALSLFDQSVALCGARLDGAELRDALGVVDHDVYFEVTDRAAAHDRAGVLGVVDRLVNRGFDLTEFVGGLTEHLRDLLAVAATGSTELVEATEATRERYRGASRPWAEADLLHLLMVADEAAQGMREGRAPRLTLELALLKMASLAPVADLERLLGRLERLDAGELPARGSVAPAPRAVAEPATSFAPAERDLPPPVDDPRPPSDRDEGGALVFPSEPPPSRPRPPASRTPADEEPPRGAPATARDVFGTPALRRRSPEDAAGGDGATGLAPAPVLDEPEPPAAGAPELPLGRVRDAWPRVVERVRAGHIGVAAVLETAEPCGEQKGSVEVAAPDAFSRDTLDRSAELILAAVAHELGGPSPPLRFTVRSLAPETARATDPFERLRALSQEHPFFRALVERFGAVPHFP
jgi:DNA polymerase III subunit gamma/tau